MNRYGLSLGMLFTLLSIFSILAISFEAYAYQGDVKWRRKLIADGQLKKIMMDHFYILKSGTEPYYYTNETERASLPCVFLIELGRFSFTQLAFLISQGIILLSILFYTPFLCRKRNAGKLLTCTSFYGMMGIMMIFVTTLYQIFGVITPDSSILCKESATELDEVGKMIKLRNFCHKAHLKSVQPPVTSVEINGEVYTERDARKFGYCQEFGARLMATLVGLWVGVICLIIPCIPACCIPPMPLFMSDRAGGLSAISIDHHSHSRVAISNFHNEMEASLSRGHSILSLTDKTLAQSLGTDNTDAHHHDFLEDSHRTMNNFDTFPKTL